MSAQPGGLAGRNLVVDFEKYKLGDLAGQTGAPGGSAWTPVGKNLDAEIVSPADTSCGVRVLRVKRTNSGGARLRLSESLDLSRPGFIYFAVDVNRGPDGAAIVTLLRGASAVAQGPGLYINSKGRVQANVSDEAGEIKRVAASGVVLAEGKWYRLEVEIRQEDSPGAGSMDVFLTTVGMKERKKIFADQPYSFDFGPYENLYVGPQSGEMDLANILVSRGPKR